MTNYTTTTVSNLTNGINRPYMGHFFDKETLRFFRSKIYTLWQDESGFVLFVTSEKFDRSTPRLYTIRKFDPSYGNTSQIETVGSFQEYKTLKQAEKALGLIMSQ
jgi:hypothetical protein